MDRVKGISLLRNSDFIKEVYGRDAFEKLCGGLRPATARILREGPIRSTWYDVEAYFDQIRGIASLFGGDDPAPLMQALGANSAELDLNSVYRFFLRFGNPGFVISQGSVMWKNYYDGGRLLIRERESRRVLASLYDERTLPPLTCDLIQGWAARAIELSGGKDVAVEHLACRDGGGPSCDFQARWA